MSAIGTTETMTWEPLPLQVCSVLSGLFNKNILKKNYIKVCLVSLITHQMSW